MGSEVIAAFVAGGFAIIGPIATYLITKTYERRFLNPIGKDRIEALTGKWQGKLFQRLQDVPADVTMQLTVTRREVAGQVHLRSHINGEDHFIALSLAGGFMHDRFLRFDYKNANKGTIQFGSVVLELASHPVTMEGQYVGYGSITGGIVSGSLSVTKSPV